MRSTRPELTPNTVKAILMFTARRLVDANNAALDSLTVGAGGVNVAGAHATRAIDTGVPQGQPWRPTLCPGLEIDGSIEDWAQNGSGARTCVGRSHLSQLAGVRAERGLGEPRVGREPRVG